MKNLKFLLLILFITHAGKSLSQDTLSKAHPYMKAGYGYINDELMIGGDMLCAETGIRLKNNYILSLNYKFGETTNNKGNFSYLGVSSAQLIYTTKIVTFFTDYDFRSKNGRHSFMPGLGVFYSKQNWERWHEDESANLLIDKDSWEDIGFAGEISYYYNFVNGISLGINCSAYLSTIMGPLYYTVSPVMKISL
ncbi:MAG: hypothetical protein ACOYXB_12685 [Bacteroidota bacterium]